MQEQTSCVYTHAAADFLDLVKELGKRRGSLSTINLETISHFICLFSALRTALLKKACQILVTSKACAHAACMSMDFQSLLHSYSFYNYACLRSSSEIARRQFCFVLIAANDLLTRAVAFCLLLPWRCLCVGL